MALDPSPSTLFFISTKFPTRAFSFRRTPGRKCANGPTCVPRDNWLDVTTEYGFMSTLSSSTASASTLPVPIVQPVPMRVLPSSRTHGSMRVSAPTVTSGSINTLSGISSVTPASITAARLRRRNTASTAARSARVLHPRTSSGSAARMASTFSPFCRNMAMASVRYSSLCKFSGRNDSRHGHNFASVKQYMLELISRMAR